jgi:hypothetical protein
MTLSRVGAQPDIIRMKMVVRVATTAKHKLVLGVIGQINFPYILGR